MHLSDIALQCANECLELANTLDTSRVSRKLIAIALRLTEAARADAEISAEDAHDRPAAIGLRGRIKC